MPILIPGRTRCDICGEVIHDPDGAIGFGPYCTNRMDALWLLSDTVFHRICFAAHPQHAVIEDLAERTLALFPGSRCDVCGGPHTDFDLSQCWGVLSSDPASPLYEFNCLRLHKVCAASWAKTPLLLGRLDEAVRAGKAGGRGIESVRAGLVDAMQNWRDVPPPTRR